MFYVLKQISCVARKGPHIELLAKFLKETKKKFLKPPSASVRGHRSREILILKTRVKLANIEECYKHQALISHNNTLLEKELFVLFVTVFLEGCEDEEGE